MRMNRSLFGASVLLGACLAASAPLEPHAGPAQRGSARNKPSGSKPVSGGGAKERARRAAKLAAENSDGDGS